MSSPGDSPSPSASEATSASETRDQLPHDDDETSDTESESSSRSVTPEPRYPPQAKVKSPPIAFEYGGCRIRKMLPRFVLPRILDPRCVAIESPTDLPLCWLGVPFTFGLIEMYAMNTGLGVPVTEGYHSNVPGSVDLMKTWLVIIDNFFEDTGITLDIRDVWGTENSVITFINNRQTCHITMDQHEAIEDILDDMGSTRKKGDVVPRSEGTY
uniref:N/A n=1 Tax=Ganoderma boninense TaxID=34458 RepID=A0A5K1K816_9APHY|nr:N/A [Ganoderma boninense]